MVEYIDSVFSSTHPPLHACTPAGQDAPYHVQDVHAGIGDPLVPEHDALKRAHVRIWADHCTERIQKAYYAALMSQEPAKQKVCRPLFFSSSLQVGLMENAPVRTIVIVCHGFS